MAGVAGFEPTNCLKTLNLGLRHLANGLLAKLRSTQ